jgi:hypothetical protein
MPEQDLDGLVLAITARLHADLARFCVLPGSEGHCSWTAPADTLVTLACTTTCSADAAAVTCDRPGGATWCSSAPTRRASAVMG